MTTTKSSARRSRNTERTDVYTRVTDRIIEQLSQGVKPWLKPWNAEHAAGRITRPLRHNGEPYHGINILMLWDSAETQGFSCPLWLTYKQAQQLGGHVKKGEKSSPVVYASSFQKAEENDDGQEVQRDVHFLKEYRVFNAEQCDGLPERFSETVQPSNNDIERIAAAEQFVRHTGADVREGGNSACYVNGADFIRMPRLETFRDAESHAATLTHELVHWTKAPSRLDRDFGRKTFGDEGYSREELVAELGSAFLCADLNVTPEVRDDHASYIDHWLQILKGDKRAIFSAASFASKAVDYLHSLQRQDASAVDA
ncbi:ArdC family protein [Fuerstiella marisgermanici]|uniref:DNA primase TraC n=1 Tax=Fuerstiella marisgermanici TaxID=1891926 RepID=A0A1P8WKD5_9PLAN|nr:zincin-like metallopeptidase domain-containing protein [Fuerstiella marisgermanici]APZ94529.1 DNA primase TraC [Fuerstiella marisgermanici]